jgi:hypothetical protein
MKIPAVTFFATQNRPKTRHPRALLGIMLVECLVYISLFFIILGVAFKLFYSCWANAKGVRRHTDEIVATLKTGERWRQDVRTATAPLRTEDSAEGNVICIPHAGGEIDYRFSEDAIWRRNGRESEWTQVLSKIKSSRMTADQRQRVTAWRWDVELASRRAGARMHPLFSFEAVPQNNQ